MIAVLCAIPMAAQSFCGVFAADGTIQTQFDNKTEKMKIYGTLPSDAEDLWVNIEVFSAKDGSLVWLGQTSADDELKYETEMMYEAELDYDSAEPLYNITVNYMHSGDKVKSAVYYTADKFTQLWMDISKAASAAEIQGLLENAGLDDTVKELNLDGTNLSAEALSGYVYGRVNESKPKTIAELKKCVRESVIFGEIENGGAAKANEYIALKNTLVDDILKLTTESGEYKLYKSSSDKIKTAFDSQMHTYYKNGEEFESAYAAELLILSIKKSDNMLQITTALDTVGETVFGEDWTDSVYAKLTKTSQKESFAKILKEKCANVEDAKALKTAFDNAGKKYKSDNSGSGSGSGSSGGSGGSGSSGGGTSIGFGNSVGSITNTQLITDMFIDLDSVSWAKESINELAKQGIISGMTENEFKPNQAVTREQFVKMLVLAFDIKTAGRTCDFDDVKETDWFRPYIAAAFEEGVVGGISDTLFGTGSYISREDMAVMAYRALEKYELAAETNGTPSFNDEARISEYAKTSVKNMAAMGIINGMGDGNFEPGGITTRAAAAKVIYALRQLYTAGE